MKKLLPVIVFLFFSLNSVFSQAGHRCAKIESNPLIENILLQVNSDSIRAYMQSLQDFGSRFTLVENRREVAGWIKNKFVSFGIEQARLDSFQLNMTFMGAYHETWQYNVVATLPGTKNPEKVYILGAHHDSVCYDSSSDTPWECSMTNAPGADDNASGVAAALEVARVMKANDFQPSNTIKFVTLAAEEVGLRGAWDFANKAADTGMKIQAMINNDMISNCTTTAPFWVVQVHKYPNAQWLSDLAAGLASQYTSLNVVESTQSIHATDSWAFYENGFPAVFLHEGQFSPFYHSTNDVVANTNKEYAAEVAKVSLAILLQLNGISEESVIYEPSFDLVDALIFPNPFSANATISLYLAERQMVSIRVFDSQGRLVFEKEPVILLPGSHEVIIDGSSFSGGLYFVSLISDTNSKVIKIVKQ